MLLFGIAIQLLMMTSLAMGSKIYVFSSFLFELVFMFFIWVLSFECSVL